jgi:hypothetical protein
MDSTTAGLRSLGYIQITNLAASVGLGSIPAGASVVRIIAEAQAVRWRDDGTDPTAAIGMPLAVGVELLYPAAMIGVLEFIEQVAGAKLNVTFYGS